MEQILCPRSPPTLEWRTRRGYSQSVLSSRSPSARCRVHPLLLLRVACRRSACTGPPLRSLSPLHCDCLTRCRCPPLTSLTSLPTPRAMFGDKRRTLLRIVFAADTERHSGSAHTSRCSRTHCSVLHAMPHLIPLFCSPSLPLFHLSPLPHSCLRPSVAIAGGRVRCFSSSPCSAC